LHDRIYAPRGTAHAYIDSNGYRILYIWQEGKRCQKLEHRVVMERLLRRPLEPHENVHHKNGVRHDNRPENLELWCKPQPCGQRVDDLVTWVVGHYRDRVIAAL
jgi:hypothetical protein